MEYLLSTMRWQRFSLQRVTDPIADFFRHAADHVIPSHRNNYHPHLLGHRALALFSALLLAAKVFTVAALSFGPVAPALSSAISEQNIISLTNGSRAQFNLPALSENPILDKAAQAKADDMLAKGYFSHNTPDGKTPWDFIISAGYSYLTAGENLAVNFTEAESVEQAWMNSPGHKANILNKNFEQIGIGISQGVFQGHEAIFVVQMFGLPADQKITLTNTPTQVETHNVPLPASPAAPAVLPANQVVVAPVLITDARVEVGDGAVKVSAETAGAAVKVLAKFGSLAVMLNPRSNTLWEGTIPLHEITQQNTAVNLEVFDMQNNKFVKQLADFSPTTAENYRSSADTTPDSRVILFGRIVDISALEDRFYLLFIAVMLSALVLAIGIKRHIQHVDMIANTSFVVVLATLLWFAG